MVPEIHSLEKLDEQRGNRIVVMASGNIGEDVIAGFLEQFDDDTITLCTPVDDTGLSPRRAAPPYPALENFPAQHVVKRVTGGGRYNAISATWPLWAVAGRLFWLQDYDGRFPEPGSGAFACGMVTALAARHGVPVLCANRFGFLQNAKTTDRLLLQEAADALTAYDRDAAFFRAEILTQGIQLDPDVCEPVLWTMDGSGLSPGYFGLSLGLTWRIVRLADYSSQAPLNLHIPKEMKRTVNSELDAIAAGLRAEIGAGLAISIAYW